MHALQFLFHAVVTTLKMAGDAIVSALWRLNVYGAVVSRVLLDGTELESLWFLSNRVLRGLNFLSAPAAQNLTRPTPAGI